MLNELAKLSAECIEAYERFDVFTVATKVREFLRNVFASQLPGDGEGKGLRRTASTKEEQEAAWFTLHEVVKDLLLLLAPITPYITDYIWRKTLRDTEHPPGALPKPKRFDVSEKVSQSIMEFNAQVWKTKREKGLALKDPIEAKIPAKLKPFEKDLVRMHHIGGKRPASDIGGPKLSKFHVRWQSWIIQFEQVV